MKVFKITVKSHGNTFFINKRTHPVYRYVNFPDYPTPETFTWEKYLKETKSVAAPVRAFKQRPVCGFKRGMRLECVDKRVSYRGYRLIPLQDNYVTKRDVLLNRMFLHGQIGLPY